MKPETPTTPQPEQESFNQPTPAFGWTAYAEQINGRFAMIGFLGILVLEAITNQGLLAWLGLK